MKQRLSREEIKERLVTDAYFKKGFSALKIRQTILMILAWLMVLFSFLWLAIPLTLPDLAVRIAFRTYLEEATAFEYLSLFLGIAFLFLVVLFVSLTLRNNRRFKKLLQKQTMHDEEKLFKRKELLDAFYEDRFGIKKERQACKYYAVPPEKNIGETEIQDLFRRNGVGD
ncbi:hypothetical protein E1H99_07020 [Enterococcus hirae]|nr:hypothetical protein E1H99_07020 [Enterococcus hirae]